MSFNFKTFWIFKGHIVSLHFGILKKMGMFEGTQCYLISRYFREVVICKGYIVSYHFRILKEVRIFGDTECHSISECYRK